MTKAKCNTVCKELGYSFMIISGTNCSCSNDTSITIGYDPSIIGDECSTPCSSDTSENCGGDNSMIIKETCKCLAVVVSLAFTVNIVKFQQLLSVKKA